MKLPKAWPRPTSQRTFVERLFRRVWLVRRDRHKTVHPISGMLWCQSSCYQDRKIARNFPKRKWLADDLPSIVDKQVRRARDVIWDIQHRTQRRYRHHVLDLRLKPGYYITDQKILHANFELIRDFVEVRLAHMTSPNEGKTYKWVNGRCRELGLDHLEWEINEADCKHGPYPTQSDAAKIKKELYLWWVDERPARIDPWSIYDLLKTKGREEEDKGLWGAFNGKRDRYRHDCSHGLEEFYNREDKEMLEKAISIFHHWAH